jgi:hypothetical protein
VLLLVTVMVVLLLLLQVPAAQAALHTQALIKELAVWATDGQQQQQQQDDDDGLAAPGGMSRLQQVCQLPLNCQEEGALLAWLRQRMREGKTGGHMLPLYLLQV